MKVKFLGVGEAFDEMLPNTSIWVRVEGKTGGNISALLDCGFTAPPLFWRSCPDPDDLGGMDETSIGPLRSWPGVSEETGLFDICEQLPGRTKSELCRRVSSSRTAHVFQAWGERRVRRRCRIDLSDG